jgi:hypothetical protein
MGFGYVVAKHRSRSVAQKAKTEYLSGMPPKKKELEWLDADKQALVFDAEDAGELVRLFNARASQGYTFSVKLVRRDADYALTLHDPKTKKVIYREKGWRDYQTDRVTPQGCNEKTGQLF